MNAIAVSSEQDRRVNPRIATLLLGLTMAFTGASGLVTEYILSTISTYILGNSIEQFSVTIALMMFMMGVGGMLQKHVGESMILEKFIAIEIALSVTGGFAPLAIYAAFGTVPDHFALVQYAFVMAIGLFIGYEIPLVARVNAIYETTLKSNLAMVLSMDYIGSFVGALVWTYILLKRFPLTEISFMVGSLNLTVAMVTLVYFVWAKEIKIPKTMLVTVLGSALAMGYGFSQNREWNTLMEQKFYDDPIVLSKTTKYQHIVATRDPELGEFRLYLNGNLQFSSLDENRYHEQLVFPVMALATRHDEVLVLGGGDGLALKRLLQYRDVQAVTLVDLDPGMTQLSLTDPTLASLNGNAFADARVLAKKSPGITSGGFRAIYAETGVMLPSGRPETEKVASVNVINVDADQFIGDPLGKQWNVVIIDFPDPNAIELAKLYSKEFYLKLKHVVSREGFVVVQASSPYHSKEAFLCIQRTMAAAGWETLPYHDNIPSFGDWGWIIAWKKDTKTQEEIRQTIAGLKTFGIDTTYLTPDRFRASLTFGMDELTALKTGINTLMQPVLLDYYQDGWQVD